MSACVAERREPSHTPPERRALSPNGPSLRATKGGDTGVERAVSMPAASHDPFRVQTLLMGNTFAIKLLGFYECWCSVLYWVNDPTKMFTETGRAFKLGK